MQEMQSTSLRFLVKNCAPINPQAVDLPVKKWRGLPIFIRSPSVDLKLLGKKVAGFNPPFA